MTATRRLTNKILLFCALFSSHARAVATESFLNLQNVGHLLRGMHNIEWPTYIHQADDALAARKNLLAIYREPESVKLPVEHAPELELLKRRALIEFGRFARTAEGTLCPEAVELFSEVPQKIATLPPRQKELAQLAYLEALKNSGTPEAATAVMKYIASPDPSIALVATSLVEEMLRSSAPSSDPTAPQIDSGTEYNPNIYTPLTERTRQKEWRKVISDLATVFSDAIATRAHNQPLIDEIRKAQHLAFEFVSQADSSRSKQQLPNLTPKVQNPAFATADGPATVKAAREEAAPDADQGGQGFKIFLGALALIVALAGAAYIFKTRRG